MSFFIDLSVPPSFSARVVILVKDIQMHEQDAYHPESLYIGLKYRRNVMDRFIPVFHLVRYLFSQMFLSISLLNWL